MMTNASNKSESTYEIALNQSKLMVNNYISKTWLHIIYLRAYIVDLEIYY